MEKVAGFEPHLLRPRSQFLHELPSVLQVLQALAFENPFDVSVNLHTRLRYLVDEGRRVDRGGDPTNQPGRVGEEAHLLPDGLHCQKLPPFGQGFFEKWLQTMVKLSHWQGTNSFGVIEEQAVGVEGRGARAEARGVPFPRELVETGKLLLALRMRPAQEGEVAHERLGHVALALVLRDALATVAFGKLLAVVAQDQAEVNKLRFFFAQGPVKEGLASGVRKVLFSPDDVGYAHGRVVYDRREVVGRGAVGFAYYEVLDVGEADLAPQGVLKCAAPRGWPEVQGAPSDLVLHLVSQPGFRETQHGPIVEAHPLALPVRP